MNTEKIWEINEPIITNVSQLQELSKHPECLKGKTITIEDININDDISEYLENILENGKIDTLRFNHISMIGDFFQTILNLNINSYVNTFAINNCNLNPNEGVLILDIMNPYGPFIKIDLSNNQIGGNGYQKFLLYLKNIIKTHIKGFSSLNLSNNGFQTKDIEEFKYGLNTHDLDIVTF